MGYSTESNSKFPEIMHNIRGENFTAPQIKAAIFSQENLADLPNPILKQTAIPAS